MTRWLSVSHRRRVWILGGICLAVLLAVATWAQFSNLTPLLPQTLTAQDIPPTYLWNTGAYGTAASSIEGASTAVGTTLLLNSVYSREPARANYTLSFPDLRDLQEYAASYTLYLPGLVTVASNGSPLHIEVAGHSFVYHPTLPVDYAWYDANPAYVPQNDDLVQLPIGIAEGGDYPFLTFSFNSTTLAQSTSVSVSIEAPAFGQIYLPDLILSLDLSNLSADQPGTSLWVGLATLPAAGAALVGVYYGLRRFGAGRYAGTLAVAFCAQVALAPIFMHSDVSTLIRYSHLFFNYRIVNLETWVYGLVWYAAILIPVAPAYSLAVAPSFAEWDLLLKLPAIAADLLTFLVLVRLLRPRVGESRAYWYSTIGWLFNPLVVYMSAVHGLGESVVALFLAVAVLAFTTGKMWSGVVATILAALTILPAAILFVPTLLSRRTSWLQRVVLVLAPIVAYVAIFLVLYGSLDPLEAYFVGVVARTNGSGLVLGSSTNSTMTYLFLLLQRFGVYISPLPGVIALVVIAGFLTLRRIEILGEWTAVTFYGSMVAFYFSYEVFFVQHLVWALPALVAAVALAPRISKGRGLAFVVVCSTLATSLNFEGQDIANAAVVLAPVLFAWLLVPVLLWLPEGATSNPVMKVGRSLSRIAGAIVAALWVILAWAHSFHPLATLVFAAVAGAGLAWLELADLGVGKRFGRLWNGARWGTTCAVVVAPLGLFYYLPLGSWKLLAALGLVLLVCGLVELVGMTLAWIRAVDSVATGAQGSNLERQTPTDRAPLNPPPAESPASSG